MHLHYHLTDRWRIMQLIIILYSVYSYIIILRIILYCIHYRLITFD